MSRLFTANVVVDRRKSPSHGYRAVHVVVTAQGRWIEVQVRTQLQHLWAEMSEKLADKLGSKIKYGRGDRAARSLLNNASRVVAEHELKSRDLAQRIRDRERIAELFRSAIGKWT